MREKLALKQQQANRGANPRFAFSFAVAVAFLSTMCGGVGLAKAQASPQRTWKSAADAAGKFAPAARIVVLDAASGRLLASTNLHDTKYTLAEPGSTLKPLVLYQLIAAGRAKPETRVACARNLVIGSHRLNCTHPAAPPFDAAEALTWSCNSYFAALAGSLNPQELRPLLRTPGLLAETALASDEATATFREPRTHDETALAVLGVEGVRVTPLELAVSYRWLARELGAHAESIAAKTVRKGLADSASFGMAGAASLGGVPVIGKTGTASLGDLKQTHGWFAGIAGSGSTAGQVVVVVYLPAGRGTDAARVAAELLKNSPLAQAKGSAQ